MNDLGSRLARLKGTACVQTKDRVPAESAGTPSIGLTERLGRLRSPDRGREVSSRITESELADVLGGALVSEGLIEFRELVETRAFGGAELDYSYASFGIDCAGLSPAFLDTETTGLAGGTGTLAFLVGIATIRQGALDVRQWLMTRFGAEADLLEIVGKAFAQSDFLVTYNGKSFDVPLLSTRYRMHGIADALGGLPHVDMLHPIRRFWARRWPDCRLATAESRLLGVTRHGDLPGSEAPDSWFAWIREGDFGRLAGVIRHNRQDLLSLADLPRAVGQAVRTPRAGEIDLAAVARQHEKRGEPAVARRLLCAHEATLEWDVLLYLARLFKRDGRWQDAVGRWGRLAESGVAEAMTELAKYHEHVSRDLGAALHWTHSAIRAEGSNRHHTHRECRLLRKRASQSTRERHATKAVRKSDQNEAL